MANLNKVMLIGNLTRDPEVRYTPKGTAVTDIALAVNRIYSTDEGERREEATFVDVTLWGRQAEIAGQYMRKGRPVFVEGRLQMDTWEDKQTGQKRSRLKVIGEAFQFLGGKEDGSSPAGTPSTQEFAPPGGGGYRTERPSGGRPQPSGGSGYRSEEPHPASPPPDFGHEEEDDIPF
ncbi:MAG: single-stranded DNA-binding protein [Verrucomicrobiales bacterium]|nr:single-stranded DNA-binding protein [Verrucomicrobiales bacterium]